MTRPGVLRFLTCSTVFPGAIAYCAREAEQALAMLSDSGPIVAIAARLSAALAVRDGPTIERQAAAGLLAEAQAELSTLQDAHH